MMLTPWHEFLQSIRTAREELGDPEVVWYRGHSNAAYSLVPGIHRISNGLSKEKVLFNEFERSAVRLFTKRENDWGTLFDMQHYGIPTRLLDWTEVLGVAVAFAVLDHNPSYGDAAIFVLDPVGLNDYSGLSEIKNISDPGFEYKLVYWENKPFAASYPIAIAPPYQNDRMFAQQGCFTVHGFKNEPIELLCSDVVRKVLLPVTALEGAREFLEHANLNAYSIYPDIVGMARHIRKKYLGI